MMTTLRLLISVAVGLLPASNLKNWVLSRFPGWSVHKTAHVAPILIANVKRLQIDEGVRVAVGCFLRNVDTVELKAFSRIGPGNSINSGRELTRYVDKPRSYLRLEPHSIVTWRHYIDCSGGFTLGEFSLLAGRQSVILTHGVDIGASLNRIAPVHIGSHCFISTNCRILAGVNIADRIVVGAGSVVTRDLTENDSLYGGAPAIARKSLAGAKYFTRRSGHVWPEGHPQAG